MKIILFALGMLLLSCFPVYASGSEELSTPSDAFDIFGSGVQIPDFPVDSDKPYQFVAYYPFTGKYLLVNSDIGLRFLSGDVPYHYYIDLMDCNYSLYEWTVGLDSWRPGGFSDGSVGNTNWYGWVGYGDCDLTFYGAKKILYSNFHVRFDEDNSIMYYKTPKLSGLDYQWSFSNMIQTLCGNSFQLLVCICFGLLVLSVMCHYVIRLIHVFLKRYNA